jgi:hypothetical protein
VLFSFLYAEAVTHVLSPAGEIIIASKRIQLSSFKDPAGIFVRCSKRRSSREIQWQPRKTASRINVPMTETTIEPRQPRRLEKKANIH